MESWIQIVNHPNYCISDLGRVKSTKYKEERILKPFRVGNYLGVWLDTYNKYYIHHLVAQAFLEHAEGKTIDHINRDKKDNRLVNLRYASLTEQMINTGITKRNTSGYKNIVIKNYGYDNIYEVKMYRKNKLAYYKRYKDLNEAITARDNFLNNE
jgi:hypothetical protein